MCDCDYETPDFYRERLIKKTRKPHECCECRKVIQPGNSMNEVSGKWGGELSSFYICLTCQEKINAWQEQNPDECFCHGDLYELLSWSESDESEAA